MEHNLKQTVLLILCGILTMPCAAMSNMSMMTPGQNTLAVDGSGTSWLPASTPMVGWHVMAGDWMLMWHGNVNFVQDQQGGKRGDSKGFSESMLMLMAERPFAKGTLGIHTMVSLDPLMGKSGYPLLLQTGETANGITPLIDRQHPHDFWMELAAVYTQALDAQQSVSTYIAYPGEPALGPPTFMHRLSGMVLPEAPITHHWLDATHVCFGVVTLGYSFNNLKLEGSVFNGREPDQNRWSMDPLRLSSSSLRLTYNPDPNWSLQVSYGHIISPEQLESDVDVDRTTASAIYNLPFGKNNWQTTFAWGQNNNRPGHRLNGYLLESGINLNHTHNFVGRYENVAKDELFLPGQVFADSSFTVQKLSLGYRYDFPTCSHMQWGIGALISTYVLPEKLWPSYDKQPWSGMLFAGLTLK